MNQLTPAQNHAANSSAAQSKKRPVSQPGAQAPGKAPPAIKLRGYAKTAAMLQCWTDLEQTAKASHAERQANKAKPVIPAAPAVRAVVPPLKLPVASTPTGRVGGTPEVRSARQVAGSPRSPFAVLGNAPAKPSPSPRGPGNTTNTFLSSDLTSGVQTLIVVCPNSPRELTSTTSPRATPAIASALFRNGLVYENPLYESQRRGHDNPLYFSESDQTSAAVQALNMERNREASVKDRARRRTTEEQAASIGHMLDTVRTAVSNAVDIKNSIPITPGSEQDIERSILDSLRLTQVNAESELTEKEISYTVSSEFGIEQECDQTQLSALIGPVAKRFRPAASNKLVDVLSSAVNKQGIQFLPLRRTDVQSISWTFVHQDDGLKASYKMRFQVNQSMALAELNGSIELDDSQKPVRASHPLLTLPGSLASSPPRSRGQKS